MHDLLQGVVNQDEGFAPQRTFLSLYFKPDSKGFPQLRNEQFQNKYIKISYSCKRLEAP